MAYGSILTAEEDGPRARKGRGAFFTPPQLAKFLVDFAVRTGEGCVLEPSCGEAEFLKAAALRLKQLGASSSQIDANLVGCELHGDSASAAQSRLARLGLHLQILVSDFFDLDPNGFGELDALPSVSLSVAPGARWPSGHAADDASRSLDALEGKGLARLSSYGEVRLGAVTGANNFFTLIVGARV